MGPTIGQVLCYQAGTMVRALLWDGSNDDKCVQCDESISSMPIAVAFEVQKEWIKVSLFDSGCDRTRQKAFFLPEPAPH